MLVINAQEMRLQSSLLMQPCPIDPASPSVHRRDFPPILAAVTQAAFVVLMSVCRFPHRAEPFPHAFQRNTVCQVAEMKAKLAELSDVRKAHLTRQADRMATDLEAQRELDSVCLVVDMDMFFAAVEIRSGSPPAKAPAVWGKRPCFLPLLLDRHPSHTTSWRLTSNRNRPLLASVTPAAASASCFRQMCTADSSIAESLFCLLFFFFVVVDDV